MLLQEINSLYIQNGVEAAVDYVSGAWLDPATVQDERAVEMGFFKSMGVYDYVPGSEQKLNAARSSGPSG